MLQGRAVSPRPPVQQTDSAALTAFLPLSPNENHADGGLAEAALPGFLFMADVFGALSAFAAPEVLGWMCTDDSEKQRSLSSPVTTSSGETANCFEIHRPSADPLPIVFDSPHSGLAYPSDFAPAPSPAQIRTTWDAYVDELYRGVTSRGATLISALFPRAYIDANRAVDDIDAELLDAPWPGPVSTTDYTRRGMGLIRRFALPGVPMYHRKLSVADVQQRIDRYYSPYRNALQAELEAAQARHGQVFHFNCHSMKSTGNAMNVDRGRARPDFVISDREGKTAPPRLTAWTAEFFQGLGYTVKVNDPYKGGDIVRSSGRPAQRYYSIQIEINRARYLDEASCERGPHFAAIQNDLTQFAAALQEMVSTTPIDHFV